MKNKTTLLATSMAIALNDGRFIGMDLASGPDRAVKPCLRCGKPHEHNNSFCSAECCKEWKAEKRKAT